MTQKVTESSPPSILMENPFTTYRADYDAEPEDLLALFVDPNQYFNWNRLLQRFPTLMRGGRGSGKTMMLRYLSFEVQLAKCKRDFAKEFARAGEAFWSGARGRRFFSDYQPFLGVYVRVDTPSYDAFQGTATTPGSWESLFGHYFSVMVSLRLARIVRTLSTEGVVKADAQVWADIAQSCLSEAYGPSFRLAADDPLQELENHLQHLKWQIERHVRLTVSGVAADAGELNITIAGRLVTRLAEGIAPLIERQRRKAGGHSSRYYIYVMLDEYEHFSIDQQKVINTLLKNSSYPVIYKLSMRNYGLKTNATLSEGEQLDPVQDYQELNIEKTTFLGDDQLSMGKYYDFLIEICRKRLERIPELNHRGWTDIAEFFPEVSPRDEALLSLGSRSNPALRELRKVVTQRRPPELVEETVEKLTCSRNPLHVWLHVLIGSRKGQDLDQLAAMHEAYEAAAAGAAKTLLSERYDSFVDHYESGLLFWHIDAIPGARKLYAGFRTYARLSCGVVRNFLALCQEAFDIAIQEEHDVGASRALPPDWQTVAAGRHAQSFRDEIRRVPRHDQVSRLVDGVGTVLKLLSTPQYDGRIAEADRSRFETAIDSVPETRLITEALELAVQRSFLYERPPRKPKSKAANVLVREYVLSRMLAPFYALPVTSRGRTRFKVEHLRRMLQTPDPDALSSACREIAREIGTSGPGRRLSTGKVSVQRQEMPIQGRLPHLS
jgi:hypothetical protein